MIKCGNGLVSTAAAVLVLTVAGTGCVTKKYVSKQVNQVNQRVAQNEKNASGKIAWLTNKEQTDISQLNEKIEATDQKLSSVASTAEGAQGTASRAMEEAGGNKETVTAVLTTPPNYRLVDQEDVLFGFNKATLSPETKAALDQVATKVNSAPGMVVEVAGFTDHKGSKSYNLDLSRRRAWAVQRYLVEHDVPSRSIHLVGLGEDRAPNGMERVADTTTSRSRAETNRELRRVNIRVLSPGEATTAGTTQQ